VANLIDNLFVLYGLVRMGFSVSSTRPRCRPINPRVKLAYLLRKHSIITNENGRSFIDCKPVLLKPYGHVYAGHLLIEYIVKNFKQTTAVAGVGFDGYAMASAVSCMSVSSNCRAIDALYVNKKEKVIEGNPDDLKSKVMVLSGSIVDITIDDIKLIQNFGHEVSGVLTMIGDGTIETKGIPIHSLFTRELIDKEIRDWENDIDYPEDK
jgi:orotate phosphoribosyltransferase